MTDQGKLDSLRASVTTISRNLMEYAATEAVATLKARSRDPGHGFTGATQAQVAGALRTLDGLWESYLLLARVLERASDLAARNGLFHNTDKELNDLLEGDSVELPVEATPVASRGLLAPGVATSRATPEALLRTMERQFLQARDALNGVAEAAARAQPRLAAIVQKAAALTDWARHLGLESPLADALPPTLAGLDSDPLACGADLDRLDSRLEQERADLQAKETERKAALDGLTQAQALIAEVKDLGLQSLAAIAETREKIALPDNLVQPVAATAIASLETWLTALEGNAATGRLGAVRIGLVKWRGEGEALLAAQRESLARNRAALEERAELRGRFLALRAKAEAQATKGQPPAALLGLAGDAERTLNLVPFDLAGNRRAVAAFEAALRPTAADPSIHS